MSIQAMPPLTGVPLDHVPVMKHRRSFGLSPPNLRRLIIAGAVAVAAVAVFLFPSIGVGAIALAAMYGFVSAGSKLAGWRNEREAKRPTTAATMWPDPFSWWPAIVALALIVAVFYLT